MDRDRPFYYVLKGKEVVPAKDVFEMALFLENPDNMIIRKTKIKGVVILTIFLGVDHNFSTDPTSLPILFETRVIGGKYDRYQDRDVTYDMAVESHRRACQLVQSTHFIMK